MEVSVSNDYIEWPSTCAYCSAPATATSTARCRVLKSAGYFVFAFTTKSREITINYPVCSAHRLLSTVASKIIARSMLHLGLGVLATLGVAAAAGWFYRGFTGSFEPLSDRQLLFTFILPGLYWFLFLWGRKYSPVRIRENNGALSFVFLNDKFGVEFKRLNQNARQ